jgi:hypothetical protein
MEEIGEVLRGYAYPEPVVEAPPEEAEAVPGAEAAVAAPEGPAEAAPAGEPVPEEAVLPAEGVEAAIPVAVEAGAPAEAAVAAEGAEPVPVSFEVGAVVGIEEVEEEAETPASDDKKRKKGKKGARVVEFDEQTGEMVVKRRRKPGRAGELGGIEELE